MKSDGDKQIHFKLDLAKLVFQELAKFVSEELAKEDFEKGSFDGPPAALVNFLERFKGRRSKLKQPLS